MAAYYGNLKRFCRDHSLTIILTILGVTSTGIGMWFVWPLEPDRWFDIFSGIGAGLGTVAVMNWLAGPFYERNKPERRE